MSTTQNNYNELKISFSLGSLGLGASVFRRLPFASIKIYLGIVFSLKYAAKSELKLSGIW
ncbi:hypothetical protein D3C86_1780890 [compost metagenome]